MRTTEKSTYYTSFHGTTIGTTLHTLRKLLGKPEYEENVGEYKVNFEWVMETENSDVFTVYDYKTYRSLDEHEIIEFHIGGMSKRVTEQAKNEMYEALSKI